MLAIKTKEGASLWIALLAALFVAAGMGISGFRWWVVLGTAAGMLVFIALAALFIIRKYVAYKLKPI